MKAMRVTLIILIILITIVCSYWFTENFGKNNEYLDAQIVDVIDGDSLVILKDKDIHRLRIVGIDAPEINTRLHLESTALIRNALRTQDYKIQVVGKDPYNRYLAYIFINEIDHNKKLTKEGSNYKDLSILLLENGYARTSKLSDLPKNIQTSYTQAQQRAKAEKKGIWAKSF